MTTKRPPHQARTPGRGGSPTPQGQQAAGGFGQQRAWREVSDPPRGPGLPSAWTGGPEAGPGFARPRKNNLLIVVAVVLLALGLVVLSAGLADTSAVDPEATRPGPATSILPGPTHQPTPDPTGESTPSPEETAQQPTYQNDDYQLQPPPSSPLPVPNPATREEARQLLVNNALYAQVAPRPIRCTITAINPSSATSEQLQQHLTELTGCLMKEWDGVLAAAGYLAVRPTVTIYTQPIQTQCGRVETRNAFYCSADQRVYYSPDFPQLMPPRAAVSRFTLLVLIAHEFGHAIQARTAVMSSQAWLASTLPKSQALAYSRRFELQADCLAGRFVGAVAQSLALTQEDRNTIAEAWNAIGDDVLWQDPDRVGDHGTGANRVSWLFTGVDNRPQPLTACNTWVAPDQKVR